ncbi:Hypothetical protein, putative [Bodo saltans]|uniref:Plus3 domain-containing protein n=1 Tax=Bodo saltans TaxID=75058 RepID=A0A0S4JRF1_BODSA|nr:Hypothetical protein, putative [Bodo saltans]|eukprot:CUG94116.1 Hypothetical protein, putative [Bodo saltans]
MKFWVLARGEKFEEQLLVSAESTEDLRKCLESLLHVSIRQMSVTDFQAQVVDKLLLQQGGNDILTVNLKTQPTSSLSMNPVTSSTTAAAAAVSASGGRTPKGGDAATAAAETSFLGHSGNPFSVSGGNSDEFQVPAPLSRTNSQSRMSSSGPPSAAVAANATDKTNASSVGMNGPAMSTSRRGSGTAAELFNADLMLPIDRICLTRESITTLLSATFRGTFHDVVKGCFVRVRGASSLATSASGYAVVQVVSVSSDTQIGLDLVHVVEVRHLDVVSNSPPTADELRIWAKHMLHAGRSPVTPTFIEAKLSDVNDALRTAAASGAGLNLGASMSFSGSAGSGGGLPAPGERSIRDREVTTIGAPWEGSLTADDAPPMPIGAVMSLDESSPPLTAASTTGSGSKLRRRQTMFLHPQNFLMSFTTDGGESTTPTKGGSGGAAAAAVGSAPPAPGSKGTSPSNTALQLTGTSPSHSSSLLLRAHMAISQAHEVVVSDDEDLGFNNSTTSSSLFSTGTGALPPPPALQTATSAKSLIKQRLDSISQAMNQHHQRISSQTSGGGGDAPTTRRAGSSGSRVVDPSQGPVTPHSGRNSSNEPSPQGSAGTQHPLPITPAFPPPPQSSAPQLTQSPLPLGPSIPPLAPPPPSSAPSYLALAQRSVVALNDALLNGWLLQHPIEDGSFEYMLFGTRHSNPKARRFRTSDFAGCCISLIDQEDEVDENHHHRLRDDDASFTSSNRRLFHSTLQLKSDIDRDVTVKGFVVHCPPQLFRGVFVALASHAVDYIQGDHKTAAGGSEGESPATSPHRGDESSDKQPASSSTAAANGVASPAPPLQPLPSTDASSYGSNAYEFTVLSGRDVTSLYNPPFKTHLPIPPWGAPMSLPHAVLRPQLVFASGLLHVFYLVGLGSHVAAPTTSPPHPSTVAAAEGGWRRASSSKSHGISAAHNTTTLPRMSYGLAHAVCSDARLSQWRLLNPTEPIIYQQPTDHHTSLVPLFSVFAGCIPTDDVGDISYSDGLTLMWCEPKIPDPAALVPPSGGRFRSPSAPRTSQEDPLPHSTMPTPPQRSQSPPPRDEVSGPPPQLQLHVTPPRRSSYPSATLPERPSMLISVLINVDDNFRSGAWAPHECSIPDLTAALAQPVGDRCTGVLDDVTRHPQGVKCMSLVRRQHRHRAPPSLASGEVQPRGENALLVVVGEDRHHRATVLLLPANVQ